MNLNQELKDYFQKNRSLFMSRDEILTIAKKKGWFNSHIFNTLKEKIISFVENREVLFGSTNGFIFTPDSFSLIGYEFIDGNISADSSRSDKGLIMKEFRIEELASIKIIESPVKINKKTSVTDIHLGKIHFWIINMREDELRNLASYVKGFVMSELELKNRKEVVKLEKLKTSQKTILRELDKDNNGEVDIVEGDDFNTLLKKHQKKVMEIDRTYIQNFVKISNYLKTKKSNIQLEFSAIGDTKDQAELNEQYHLLKNQIHGYELVLFHSLNMIVSLTEDDLITFYEIYEAFDKMGIWNSNWENEVGEQLLNIGDGLTELMYSINQMEQNIVNEIGNLTYVTQKGFSDLQSSVSNQLSSIDSTLQSGNLLSAIQTYQMYKINKNTKGLRQ